MRILPCPGHFVLAAALATLSCVSLHARGDGAGPSIAAFEAHWERQLRDAKIVGAGAAILLDRRLAWAKGFGHADADRTVAFTTDTVMNVGSIAKTVIGVAMLRAARDGRLSLDEDFNRHLDFRVANPHRPDARITLRHLATHTSGIRDRREVYSRLYHYGGDSPEPLGRFLAGYFTPGAKDHSPENFLDADPGRRREYSNIGAALAAHVVERATGEAFDAYTRRIVFEPLGMTRTGWFLDAMREVRHGALFVAQNGHVVPIPPYGIATYPDGMLRTTVSDLSRLFTAILDDGRLEGRQVFESRDMAEMRRFQFGDANRPENYPESSGNSGLFWRTKRGGALVGHGGSDPGIHTEMLADPAGRVGIVFMANTSLGGAEQRAIGRLVDALWSQGERMGRAGERAAKDAGEREMPR